jgi:predicted transposase/invertase (TIGR01784 family)
MCKINPRVDFAFQKLFGSEENKDLLISLINAIVSEQEQVVELELKNPFKLADYRVDKIFVLHIKAKAENGRWFNIQMQISGDRNFDKRAIYYWAKLVTEQLGEGMIYKELNKTISININILDYGFVPDTTEEVHRCYKIINTATGKDDVLHDFFELHYIELNKFTKKYHEIQSALDRWSSFLTTSHQLGREHTPKELASDNNIVKAIATIDRMFNEEERQVYEVRLKEFAVVASVIASGYEKNIAKGREEGREETTRTIALKLIQEGVGIEIIKSVTGLSIAVIEDLVKSVQ